MIYQDLGDVERDLDLMVGVLRLDRTLLFGVYHRMLAIKDAWLQYRAQDYSHQDEVTQEGQAILHEEQAHLADLLLKVKKMLVASR